MTYFRRHGWIIISGLCFGDSFIVHIATYCFCFSVSLLFESMLWQYWHTAGVMHFDTRFILLYYRQGF